MSKPRPRHFSMIRDFQVADFLTLLRLSDINPRYARHFLRG